MALPPLELPPIERAALLPGGPFALWKRWDEFIAGCASPSSMMERHSRSKQRLVQSFSKVCLTCVLALVAFAGRLRVDEERE